MTTPKFRVVRQFGGGITPSTAKAYRVETTELVTEAEAFKIMKDLGSPYVGRKYEEAQGLADPTCPIMTPTLSRKDIPMVKKITTLISSNRKAIARKVLIVSGVALGLVAGALLAKPEETIVIIGETTDEETTTDPESKPES